MKGTGVFCGTEGGAELPGGERRIKKPIRWTLRR